jgi:hypothetical protein
MAAVLPPEKEPAVETEPEDGPAPEPIWRFWNREKVLAVAGIRTSTAVFSNLKFLGRNLTFDTLYIQLRFTVHKYVPQNSVYVYFSSMVQ